MSDQHKDLQGNSYVTVDQAKVGVQVKCDGDFTCIPEGAIRTIQARDDGSLFIDCDQEGHDLDGQLSDDELVYVGLYPVVA